MTTNNKDYKKIQDAIDNCPEPEIRVENYKETGVFTGKNLDLSPSPLTMEEKGVFVKIDNSPRGNLLSLLGSMGLDIAKPWVDEAISSAVTQALEEEREEIIDKVNKKKLKLSQAKIETLEGELMREAVNVTLDEVISLLSNNK